MRESTESEGAREAAGDGPAPWREPALGGYPDARFFRLPGIEQLRALIAGEIPAPPIAHFVGTRIVDAGEGTAAFTMPLTEWLCSPQGGISIGPLAMPADAAVACAIQTQLPAATPFTTSELSLRLLAPVRPGGSITAHGRLIQLRRTIALADVSLLDDDQQLVAHGSSLLFVQSRAAVPPPAPLVVPPSAGEPDGVPPGAADGRIDPYLRPVRGEVVGQDVWERLSGLEVLHGQLAGSLPLPPIHHLTGLTLVSAAPGEAQFTLPATEWMCAPPRARVQGGAVAMLAEAALSSAVQAQLPAGTAVAPVDLKVNYLRPLAADGRLARATGTVVHAGRRIAVAQADVRDADGRPVAVATGSAMILAGREASLGAAR